MRDHPGQVTLSLDPGDAVVLDYRVLHGTHPNGSAARRDALLLTFAPDWSSLPDEIRAHLISHPALPRPGEPVPAEPGLRGLLPAYEGVRRDLPLRRRAPSAFAVRTHGGAHGAGSGADAA
jgi:ectoine hydroxylase-related dioxygenase (phytanoyl-CoA dioxygenase family)